MLCSLRGAPLIHPGGGAPCGQGRVAVDSPETRRKAPLLELSKLEEVMSKQMRKEQSTLNADSLSP